jgi:hypothetical protein
MSLATLSERSGFGKSVRAKVPRTRHGGWQPQPGRTDPLDILALQATTRIPELVPIRYGIYAQMCGWTLARANARSGDSIAIGSYLGNGTRFDCAMAEFAATYADQNERDHAALTRAIANGQVRATSDV